MTLSPGRFGQNAALCSGACDVRAATARLADRGHVGERMPAARQDRLRLGRGVALKPRQPLVDELQLRIELEDEMNELHQRRVEIDLALHSQVIEQLLDASTPLLMIHGDNLARGACGHSD